MIEMSFAAGNTEQAVIGFAGDTLNTAIYLHREISNSYEVSFFSRVGVDPFSLRMLNFISDEGVCVEHLDADDEKIPGLYAISTDRQGERSFSYWRDDSAARRLFQVGDQIDFSSLEQFNVIYLSGITLAILPDEVRKAFLEWLPSYRAKKDKLVVFDSNYRPKLWENKAKARQRMEQMWRSTDIALPSVDDEMLLFDDPDENAVMDRFSLYGIKTGILKRGVKGPLTFTHEQNNFEFPAAESMVDSTAAGDSFNGALLASILDGASIDDAMLAGHACACKVVSQRGAIIPAST